MTVLWVGLMMFAGTVIYCCATAMAGRAFGLGIAAVSLGAGPKLLTFPLAGASVGVGPLIVAGGVEFRGETEETPGLAGMRPLHRAVLTLTGVAALLVASTAMLGLDALHLVWQTMVALFRLALAPIENGNLIGDVVAAFTAATPWTRAGSIFAVYAGINLLPLLPLPGGGAILALVETVTGRALPEKVQRAYLLTSMLVLIWILLQVAAQIMPILMPPAPFLASIN